jgi:hypothetical protein
MLSSHKKKVNIWTSKLIVSYVGMPPSFLRHTKDLYTQLERSLILNIKDNVQCFYSVINVGVMYACSKLIAPFFDHTMTAVHKNYPIHQ